MMSSLFGSMSIALRSMLAQQGAISTTANNVSNINTPGYVRRRAELVEGDTVLSGNHMVGTGAELAHITSLRDRVLQLRIQDERQNQGSAQAQVSALQDIEPLFATDTDGLEQSINNFFNSISGLSSDAANMPLRQTVLMNAGNLAKDFRTLATTLQQRQTSLDLDIDQTVKKINEITSEIAALNGKIADSASAQDEPASFVDRRDLLLENLSDLIGNHVIVADDGLTVTTKGGTALVLGRRSTDLSVTKAADGTPQIFCGNDDITGELGGGKLQGLFTVRQQTAPGILRDLDTLAAGIATAVNDVHKSGLDLDGNAGQDMFVFNSTGTGSAAASFTLNISDARELAASSDGTQGSNGNLNALLALRNQPIVNGQSPTDYYAGMTFRFGAHIATAQSELDASDAVSQQLEDQRGALSGVSLDEEAADLIRFQRAYEAAARVLSVLSDLTEISVNLGAH